MDLAGLETYIAYYSLRGAKAQAETNENSTLIGQNQTEEKKGTEETQQNA
jgi:hypothetical protein